MLLRVQWTAFVTIVLSVCTLQLPLDSCDDNNETVYVTFACSTSFNCQLMDRLPRWPVQDRGESEPLSAAAAAATVDNITARVAWCDDPVELCLLSRNSRMATFLAQAIVIHAGDHALYGLSTKSVRDMLRADSATEVALVGCDILEVSRLPAGGRVSRKQLPPSPDQSDTNRVPLHVLLPIAGAFLVAILVGAFVAHRKWVATTTPLDVHQTSVSYSMLSGKDVDSRHDEPANSE